MNEEIHSTIDKANHQDAFSLNGRLQNVIALKALRQSGSYPDLADSIEGSIRSFDFISGGDKETKIKMNTRFTPDVASMVRAAITDSLEGQVSHHATVAEDRLAAGALLHIIEHEGL